MSILDDKLDDLNTLAEKISLSYDFRASLKNLFDKEKIKEYFNILDEIFVGLKYITSRGSSDIITFIPSFFALQNKKYLRSFLKLNDNIRNYESIDKNIREHHPNIEKNIDNIKELIPDFLLITPEKYKEIKKKKPNYLYGKCISNHCFKILDCNKHWSYHNEKIFCFFDKQNLVPSEDILTKLLSKGWYNSNILIFGLNKKPRAWKTKTLSYNESVLLLMEKSNIDLLYKD